MGLASVVSSDGTCRVFDTETGETVSRIPNTNREVYAPKTEQDLQEELYYLGVYRR